MNLPEELSIENKPPDIKSDFGEWNMVRSVAALYNSGGGLIRAGVADGGKELTYIKANLDDFSPDQGPLAVILHKYLDPIPPFKAASTDGYVTVTVHKGVTSPTILRVELTHPKKDAIRYAAGTVFMRRMDGGAPSSQPPRTRGDWDSLLHLWETNRGITVQGQILVQFTLLVNQWNPFEPGGNTANTVWQCECLADVAAPLGRPKLREALHKIIHDHMKPIAEKADKGPTQHDRGGKYKEPIGREIQELCAKLDLYPPQ